MKRVVVIIPTFRRPESLERAIRSVLVQDGPVLMFTEIAVVDNDPHGSARAVVERIGAQRPKIQYIHAPDPGVSNARNAGLAATTATLIAFLDDDEEAPPHWLSALHAAHIAFAADVTFGPVRGRADAAPAWKRAYLETFFSRFGPGQVGLTDTVHGCGCSMMTRATALAGAAPFDPSANETGGEDDQLFQRLRQEGRRFAWTHRAWVWEHAPASRQTVRYALTRAFGYGQTPAQIASRGGDWAGVIKWMAVGAGQAGLFGAMAAAMSIANPAKALNLADRAARGLGKVFWWRKLRFYGSAAACRPTPDAGPKAPVPAAPLAPALARG